MLTAYQIDALRDKATTLLDPVINFLIEDIAERVSEAGQLTGTAAYQVWRAQRLGMSQKKLKKEIAKRLKIPLAQVEQLMRQAAKTGYNFDLSRLPHKRGVPFEANSGVQQIVDAAVSLAQQNLTNIVQTMGFVNGAGQAQPLTRAYQQACDQAFMKSVTGATDYISAVRNATRGLAAQGIVSIDYASGVHTSIEAAVRRNIMGGLGLMQEQIAQHNHDALGCNGWEISAHEGSAPDHEPFQGRQYDDKTFKALNNSLVRRFDTLNCGHDVSGIILGVNEPQYTEEQLEAMRRRNAEGVTIDGKHYTLYEAGQRQRNIERRIRKRKRNILIDEKLGDKGKLETDQIRLTLLRQEYARFSKAAGLRTQHERAEVAGFTWKHGKAAEKRFTFPENHATMKAINGARITNINGTAAEAHAERYYGLVRKMNTDVARIAQNTGYPEETIQRIKNFIFFEEHDLGGPTPERFAPSFSMAQSWQRLIDGKPEPHDLTLLRHEIMEKELMDSGLSQYEAHIRTSEKYNYTKESDDYYAALKKRKNRK